ncbi:hypothetical protein M231_02837 [Tremella mesenterica]|uniref:PDEase domain-containing protein n=1 Tax=Tremella mesenterica TaxID=5217 RepID=A0A4Q1BPU1_TREME|nr:hypothetical protein M231_02837 [Tremella mesenterica]
MSRSTGEVKEHTGPDFERSGKEIETIGSAIQSSGIVQPRLQSQIDGIGEIEWTERERRIEEDVKKINQTTDLGGENVMGTRGCTFELIVLGSGGGPLETDCSGYLLKPIKRRWEDGFLALEGGSGLGALVSLFREKDPSDMFPDLVFPSTHNTPVLKAAYVFSFLECYLITHAHLDHNLSLILLSGSVPSRIPPPSHPITPLSPLPHSQTPIPEASTSSSPKQHLSKSIPHDNSQSITPTNPPPRIIEVEPPPPVRPPVYAIKHTLDKLAMAYGGDLWPQLGSWAQEELPENRKKRRKTSLAHTGPNDGSGVIFSPLILAQTHRPLHPTLPITTLAFPVNHGCTSKGTYESSAFFIRYDPGALSSNSESVIHQDSHNSSSPQRPTLFTSFGNVDSSTPRSSSSTTSSNHLHAETKSTIPLEGHSDVKHVATTVRNSGEGREFLFFGDVESGWRSEEERNVDQARGEESERLNRAIWEEAATSWIAGRLAGVFIECSYDSSRPQSLMFGHLSPPGLYHELTTLATLVRSRLPLPPKWFKSPSGQTDISNNTPTSSIDTKSQSFHNVPSQSQLHLLASNISTETTTSTQSTISSQSSYKRDVVTSKVPNTTSEQYMTHSPLSPIMTNPYTAPTQIIKPLEGLRIFVTHMKENLVPHPSGRALQEIIMSELVDLEDKGKLGVEFIHVKRGDRIWIHHSVLAGSGEEEDDGVNFDPDDIEMIEEREPRNPTGFTRTVNRNDRPLKRIFTSGVLGNTMISKSGRYEGKVYLDPSKRLISGTYPEYLLSTSKHPSTVDDEETEVKTGSKREIVTIEEDNTDELSYYEIYAGGDLGSDNLYWYSKKRRRTTDQDPSRYIPNISTKAIFEFLNSLLVGYTGTNDEEIPGREVLEKIVFQITRSDNVDSHMISKAVGSSVRC